MSKGDSSSFIKIVVLCILVILGIFYVNIMGLGHGVSEQEQVAAKLLNQRIDSTKDYVEKLEHQIMKLAMDKKNDEKGGKHIEDTLHSEGHKGTLIEHPMHHQILEHALRPNPENPNQFLPKHLVADITQHSKALPPPTVYAKVPEKHHRRHHHGHASQHASAETEQQNQVTPSSPSSTENTEQQSNFNPQLHPSAQGKFPDIPVDVEKIDPDFYNWLERIKEKFYCLEVNPHNIGYYHYHVRKAAGTTIRDIVKTSLSRFKKSAIARRQMLRPSVVNVDNYYETEGVVLLYPDILEIKDLLSMISLRDPINRILSLYWYEHVGWYDGVLKQPHRCKSMETWIEAWLDGSEFKNTFVKKFPDNNYVEIENYYVKSLIGHIYQSEHLDIHTQGGEELTSKDLEKAKEMLRKFDVIFITEWMGDDTEMDVVNTIFPGRTQIAPGHKVKGDFRMKERLRPTLAANEEELKKKLAERNKFDMELYEYAQSLISLRLKFLIPIYQAAKAHAMKKFQNNGDHSASSPAHLRSLQAIASESSNHNFNIENFECSVTSQDVQHRKTLLSSKYKKIMGVLQPPGHKGP